MLYHPGYVNRRFTLRLINGVCSAMEFETSAYSCVVWYVLSCIGMYAVLRDHEGRAVHFRMPCCMITLEKAKFRIEWGNTA